MTTPNIDVFITILYVTSRATFPTPTRYKAQWVARGTGTVMYTSKVCDTRERAVELAKKYLTTPVGAHLADTTRASV